MTLAAVAVAVAVALGAFAQTQSGIGVVLVCGPVLVAVLGPAAGVRLAVTVSLVLNVAVLARGARSVRVGDALRLLGPAVAVAPLAAVVVRRLDPRPATVAAGVSVLVATALLASGRRWQAAGGPTGAVAAGAASAIMNVLAGLGGPAAAVYATNAGWSPATLVATLQLYFLGLNTVTLASLGPPRELTLLLAAVVGLLAGVAVGEQVSRRTSADRARTLTLALAAAGGVAVVVRVLV